MTITLHYTSYTTLVTLHYIYKYDYNYNCTRPHYTRLDYATLHVSTLQ